jgi:hypothetical protein
MPGGDSGSMPRPAKPAPQAARTASPEATGGRQTSEPLPPLGVSVETTSLQKNTRGGIASLLFTVTAGVAIDDAVLSARTPAHVLFADGSSERTWKVNLAAAGTVTVPVDVIVPEDGKYAIAVDVSGRAHGKTIHRAASHKLLVGVKEHKGKVKGGAIEYPAAESAAEGS